MQSAVNNEYAYYLHITVEFTKQKNFKLYQLTLKLILTCIHQTI